MEKYMKKRESSVSRTLAINNNDLKTKTQIIKL